MDLLEKEILKYEKNNFKAVQRRTLKHGSKIVLKQKRFGGLASESVYLYYIDGDCTVDSLREVFKDYVKFYEESVSGRIGESGKGYLLCSGSVDDKLFKDVRKALIRSEDARNSIKLVSSAKKEETVLAESLKRTEERQVTKGKVSSELKAIMEKIKGFHPPRVPKKEKDLDNMLISYLSASFSNIRTQMAYEKAKIDAQIGRIGIEIKYQPNASELNRLYGQIDAYCKHFDQVVVVIGYARSREDIESFQERLKERGWLNSKVFVIAV
jgi:hypothetical protein